MPKADLTTSAIRHFKIAYIASICLLALLATTGLMVEEWTINQSRWDAHEVNLAGRQRLLSARMIKLMLITTFLPNNEFHDDPAQLAQVLTVWNKNHQALRYGDQELHLPGARGLELKKYFKQIVPHHAALSQTVQEFLQLTRSAAPIWNSSSEATLVAVFLMARANQMQYVTLMDKIVATLEREASGRLERARLVNAAVLGAIFLVLGLLAFFVMRPTINRLREVMEQSERERMGLAGFVSESPSPIIRFKPDGSGVVCNRGAENLLANLPGALADYGVKIRALFKDCLEHPGDPFDCEDLEVEVAERYYLFHFIYVGGSNQVFALGIDITSRKQAEQAIVDAKDAAEAANKLKSDFLATMSHELRTPLNAIIGFSQALTTGTYGEMDPKQTRKLEHIYESGRHLLGLIDVVLDLSQIEAGRMKLNLSPVPVAELISDSLNMVHQEAKAKGIKTSVHIASQVRDLSIQADERKLNRIIFNLLSNAVKFTPPGGQVTLSSRLGDKDEELLISVNDNGVGFSPEEGGRMFESFFQAESDLKRNFEGSGLGLALCRRLVEMHGGHIWAISEGKNQGSTFSFTLPIRPDRPAELGEPPTGTVAPQNPAHA